MGRRHHLLTPARLWLIVPALVATGDPLLIRSGQPTLSAQYDLWREHSRLARFVLPLVCLYLVCHLNRWPRVLLRFDPLSFVFRRLEAALAPSPSPTLSRHG